MSLQYGKFTNGINSKMDCTLCENTNCIIKRNLESNLKIDLIHKKNQINCKKGQQFIIEGAPVTGLFFVLKGKVKVFRTGINGKEQIVRFANTGDIIGHRGFGTNEFYSIGAVALEEASLCYFSTSDFQEALLSNNTFAYDMMLFYANELNRSESKVKSLSQMTVRERVVDALLYFDKKFKSKKGFIDLFLTRKEYADFVGTSEEQIIRVFSALKKENLIQINGKKITILHFSKLQSEISEHNYYLLT